MKKNTFLGIIGSIIGALIGVIPWVLMYVYGGWILSVLALPIAFLSYKGYTLLKGEVTDKTWILIVIMSILSISLATFIGVPLLLNLKNGSGISLNNLFSLYQSEIFLKSLIGDYILSLVFTILGISGLVGNIKNNNKYATENSFDIDSSDVKKVINAFMNHDATSSKKAIALKEIASEVDILNKDFIIKELKNRNILLGKNKMYIDKEALENKEFEENKLKKQSQRNIKIIAFIVLGLLIVYFVLISLGGKSSNNSNNDYDDYNFMNYATYKLPNYLVAYEEDFDEEYFNQYGYYSVIYTPISSYRKEPIFRTIYVDYIPDYYYDNFDEYKKEITDSSSEDYKVSEVNLIKDTYDYEVIEIKALGEENKIYYDYYLFNEGNSLFFEFITYEDKDVEKFSTEIKKVIKSVKFMELEEKTVEKS